MIFNSIQPLEAACPWPRNAMEMTRKHWNVRLLTYQKLGKHSWLKLISSFTVMVMMLLWWCWWWQKVRSKTWTRRSLYCQDWLIYTNDKGFRGEDFVDAIRILIQATETTIWLQGHNIQIVSRHHSRFYYAIAFISDSIQFLCSQQVS